jgi:hypothetical protein
VAISQTARFPVVFCRDRLVSPQFCKRAVLHVGVFWGVSTRVMMIRSNLVAVAFVWATLASAPMARAGDYQLPPEVTPQIKAACETDVRRLCIGSNPTVDKVKSCVSAKFMQLGRSCQVQLALAGLKP